MYSQADELLERNHGNVRPVCSREVIGEPGKIKAPSADDAERPSERNVASQADRGECLRDAQKDLRAARDALFEVKRSALLMRTLSCPDIIPCSDTLNKKIQVARSSSDCSLSLRHLPPPVWPSAGQDDGDDRPPTDPGGPLKLRSPTDSDITFTPSIPTGEESNPLTSTLSDMTSFSEMLETLRRSDIALRRTSELHERESPARDDDLPIHGWMANSRLLGLLNTESGKKLATEFSSTRRSILGESLTRLMMELGDLDTDGSLSNLPGRNTPLDRGRENRSFGAFLSNLLPGPSTQPFYNPLSGLAAAFSRLLPGRATAPDVGVPLESGDLPVQTASLPFEANDSNHRSQAPDRPEDLAGRVSSASSHRERGDRTLLGPRHLIVSDGANGYHDRTERSGTDGFSRPEQPPPILNLSRYPHLFGVAPETSRIMADHSAAFAPSTIEGETHNDVRLIPEERGPEATSSLPDHQTLRFPRLGDNFDPPAFLSQKPGPSERPSMEERSGASQQRQSPVQRSAIAKSHIHSGCLHPRYLGSEWSTESSSGSSPGMQQSDAILEYLSRSHASDGAPSIDLPASPRPILLSRNADPAASEPTSLLSSSPFRSTPGVSRNDALSRIEEESLRASSVASEDTGQVCSVNVASDRDDATGHREKPGDLVDNETTTRDLSRIPAAVRVTDYPHSLTSQDGEEQGPAFSFVQSTRMYSGILHPHYLANDWSAYASPVRFGHANDESGVVGGSAPTDARPQRLFDSDREETLPRTEVGGRDGIWQAQRTRFAEAEPIRQRTVTNRDDDSTESSVETGPEPELDPPQKTRSYHRALGRTLAVNTADSGENLPTSVYDARRYRRRSSSAGSSTTSLSGAAPPPPQFGFAQRSDLSGDSDSGEGNPPKQSGSASTVVVVPGNDKLWSVVEDPERMGDGGGSRRAVESGALPEALFAPPPLDSLAAPESTSTIVVHHKKLTSSSTNVPNREAGMRLLATSGSEESVPPSKRSSSSITTEVIDSTSEGELHDNGDNYSELSGKEVLSEEKLSEVSVSVKTNSASRFSFERISQSRSERSSSVQEDLHKDGSSRLTEEGSVDAGTETNSAGLPDEDHRLRRGSPGRATSSSADRSDGSKKKRAQPYAGLTEGARYSDLSQAQSDREEGSSLAVSEVSDRKSSFDGLLREASLSLLRESFEKARTKEKPVSSDRSYEHSLIRPGALSSESEKRGDKEDRSQSSPKRPSASDDAFLDELKRKISSRSSAWSGGIAGRESATTSSSGSQKTPGTMIAFKFEGLRSDTGTGSDGADSRKISDEDTVEKETGAVAAEGEETESSPESGASDDHESGSNGSSRQLASSSERFSSRVPSLDWLLPMQQSTEASNESDSRTGSKEVSHDNRGSSRWSPSSALSEHSKPGRDQGDSTPYFTEAASDESTDAESEVVGSIPVLGSPVRVSDLTETDSVQHITEWELPSRTDVIGKSSSGVLRATEPRRRLGSMTSRELMLLTQRGGYDDGSGTSDVDSDIDVLTGTPGTC